MNLDFIIHLQCSLHLTVSYGCDELFRLTFFFLGFAVICCFIQLFLYIFKFHMGAVQSAVTWLCFSPNSEQVITASKDGTIRVWNINGISFLP